MKKIILLLMVLLMCHSAQAGDYASFVFPDTNKVEVVTTSIADTVLISIYNTSSQPISGFFVTVSSDDSVFVLENILDNTVNQPFEIDSDDTPLYLNQLTTRWIIGGFVDSVQLKIYTVNSVNAQISFCGSQTFPFFGMVEPITPICCVGMRGNIDGDAQEIIDIGDLIYLVQYSFGTPNGPAPPCLDEADVNASGEQDIADIIDLIGYMFNVGEGLPPADCP